MFSKWARRTAAEDVPHAPTESMEEKDAPRPRKWNLGILSDPLTDEVPGSVILLSSVHKRNEPLGLQHVHARTSASSLPSPFGLPGRSRSRRSRLSSPSRRPEKKRTKDGKFILEPQPEETPNDPLNWAKTRRDVALISLGFYCMVGGGMTPLLAAGFNNVAATYHVSVPQVALTTGLYMLGLGLGSVVASPTAILWGKRPVYLAAIILFMLSSIWCALSPNYPSLVVARIVQGFAVSPVECLPSATVAEIFFLHERAYRLGIYTLLLLGGKNIIPLVSAAIVQSLGWRWTFWMVAIVVGFCFFLIFFFVPETFWDRTPTARGRTHSSGKYHPHTQIPSRHKHDKDANHPFGREDEEHHGIMTTLADPEKPRVPRTTAHVGFAPDAQSDLADSERPKGSSTESFSDNNATAQQDYFSLGQDPVARIDYTENASTEAVRVQPPAPTGPINMHQDVENQAASQSDGIPASGASNTKDEPQESKYTEYYRSAPPKSYLESLKPWNGRLAHDKWLHVMIRPFILFAYPAVLWSSMVYALAVGWLIVLSESVAEVYRDRESYNFTALQVGLVYISPFVGGILGTAVAGKISDLIVRYMARKNDGVYEPEYRLVMAIPIAISTTIGLMGFGWSAHERDNWIVPTVFFGIISFGCSLASTTAVTFVVDSYRVYAGEALVTLNFSKNIFHGFMFSLFFPHWLEADGPKNVFLAVGGIQMGCMLFSIPMYIYGKRARMWTVRKRMMESF